ncbi:hypothetical protein K190097F3_20110 [Enterocloster clostridioformis]
MLKIISWFQLPIEHGIFLHSHKGCIRVCFGITIAFSTHIEFFTVFFEFAYVGFQCFNRFLEMGFSASRSMDNYNPFLSLILYSFLRRLFKV